MLKSLDVKTRLVKDKNCKLPNEDTWMDFESPKKFWISPSKQVNLGEFSQNMTRRLNFEEDLQQPTLPFSQLSSNLLTS